MEIRFAYFYGAWNVYVAEAWGGERQIVQGAVSFEEAIRQAQNQTGVQHLSFRMFARQ